VGAFLGPRQGAAGAQARRAMNIVWSPQAVADLAALRAYIAEDDKAAAQRVVCSSV
jgi:plasmid stabilization system protein ParE